MWWAPIAAAAVSAIGNQLSGNRQMAFQERMSSTSLTRAAADAQRAGLNRVLAFDNAASTPGGAMPLVPDVGPALIQAASAKQQIEQSKVQTELLDQQKDLIPAQIDQTSAAAAREQTQADLNREQRRLVSAEADKAEVTKGLYKAVAPLTDKLIDWVGGKASSAADMISPDAARKVLESGANSAKVITTWDKYRDSEAVIRAEAHDMIKQIRSGRLSQEAIKDMNPKVREYIYRLRPEWK